MKQLANNTGSCGQNNPTCIHILTREGQDITARLATACIHKYAYIYIYIPLPNGSSRIPLRTDHLKPRRPTAASVYLQQFNKRRILRACLVWTNHWHSWMRECCKRVHGRQTPGANATTDHHQHKRATDTQTRAERPRNPLQKPN